MPRPSKSPGPASVPPARIGLSSPVQLAATIPHLLGFRPESSLVLVGVSGPRRRVGLALRLDLAVVDARPRTVEGLAERIRLSGGEQVLAAIFTDEPGLPPDLPRSGLVARLARIAPLFEAVLVRGATCWSYLCDDPRCCPSAGRSIDPDAGEVTRIDAEFAAVGVAVLRDRAAVVAQIRPVRGDEATAVAARLPAAVSWVQARPAPRLEPWVMRHLERLVTAYEDPRASVDLPTAVRMLVALWVTPVRDRVLIAWMRQTGGSDGMMRGEAWRRLFRDIARLAPPPMDAPACTLFALMAYREGNGVLADAALTRALDGTPDYSLAVTLQRMLAGQVHPRQLMRWLRSWSPDGAA